MHTLDLYSTSQTQGLYSTTEYLGFDFIPQKKYTHGGCIYHAPYFAIEKNASERVWSLQEGCCNHWDCPRCGVIRAKQEYWRIVSGSQQIVSEGHAMYFITITTRGSGCTVAEAEKDYLQWTNRLFSNLRGQSRRRDAYWCYVQVTERQKRKHPHSHILTTYKPVDLIEGKKLQYEQRGGVKWAYYQPALRSDNLQAAICASGLGEQYDISVVREVSAVARYVAKYLFKSSLHTVWPKGWKRVRYSHNWPKTSLPKSNAIALVNRQDWFELATMADKVLCSDQEVYEVSKNALWAYPVEVKLREAKNA